MIAPSKSHWIIRKDTPGEGTFLWYVNHVVDDSDPHFCSSHDYGALGTFKEALTVMRELSWKECGLALDQVPFYGLELGIDTPDGLRTCALDVAGFHYLEEAITYAETLRRRPAQAAMERAERDGHMVSPMDADDGDLHRPLVGATVYYYDPEVGTTWSLDLVSWDYSALVAS